MLVEDATRLVSDYRKKGVEMSERRTEVKTIRVDLFCDACDGLMVPTGLCLTSIPPQYPHQCEKCGVSVTVRGRTYPYLIYEDVQMTNAPRSITEPQFEDKPDVVSVPTSMVMVPREPTTAMLIAARDWSLAKYGKAIGNDGASGCYRAMLAAVQEPK